ncbi:MAG: Rnase Y domain-containing protein, partial [Candidatus Omnitrophota bacterium]
MQEYSVFFQVTLGVLFFILGFFLRMAFAERQIKSAEQKAYELLEEGKRKSETIQKDAERAAQELLLRTRENFEREVEHRKQEVITGEKRLAHREGDLNKKVDILDKREREVTEREKTCSQKDTTLKKRDEELNALIAEEKH